MSDSSPVAAQPFVDIVQAMGEEPVFKAGDGVKIAVHFEVMETAIRELLVEKQLIFLAGYKRRIYVSFVMDVNHLAYPAGEKSISDYVPPLFIGVFATCFQHMI